MLHEWSGTTGADDPEETRLDKAALEVGLNVVVEFAVLAMVKEGTSIALELVFLASLSCWSTQLMLFAC